MPSISTAPPALPRPSSILDSIRSSCQSVTEAAGIKIRQEALQQFIDSIDEPASPKDYSLIFPLRWDSTAQEVNFLSLLSVLSILSPNQYHLQQLSNDPSPSSIPRHLLLGLYLSSPPSNHLSAPSPLSSGHLASLGDGEIADILGLKIHQEKKVEHVPVATLAERGGPGSEVTSKLRGTINRLGEKLIENRYVDLGAFVIETLQQCKGLAGTSSEEEATGHFVNRTVSLLCSDLTDSHNITIGSTQPLHLYKNALLILLSLTLRFGSMKDALPWLPSPKVFPMVADGLMPGLLVSKGMLDFSAAKDAKLKTWAKSSTSSVELTDDQANTLRAAMVHVGQQASELLQQRELNVLDLDAALRRQAQASKGKDAEMAGLLIRESDIELAGLW